ncbi:hypothetical protein P691DRAFT_806048 [Macrolepiota fuliginosa MF-IS2]|uniref:Uncharacterized protein n=1 Tax=Macrolepiota fuliginosa MF-IS2 TaxID=1400762 RepID=A0A9P5XIB5_9AGAR|nr:hypothetical protein P691DRAFT_806048 [Macrolepiota fuliginosa MF-IS2]
MERHYIQDEPGVIPYEPTGVAVGSGSGSPDVSQPMGPREIHVSLPRSYPRNSSPGLEVIPTPALEQSNPFVATLASPDSSSSSYYSYPRTSDSRPSSRRPNPPAATSPSPRPSSLTLNSDSSPPPLVNATPPSATSGVPPDQKDLPTSRALKPGDVLFWHHLTRCGEIPGVEDDKRARSKSDARGAINRCPSANGNNVERRGRSLGSVMFSR